jgi:hypothetical protein
VMLNLYAVEIGIRENIKNLDLQSSLRHTSPCPLDPGFLLFYRSEP